MPLFYETEVRSRLLLGTARYPSPAVLAEAVRRSGTDIVTVSLRRETAGGRQGGAFFELIRELGVRVLPNTAGCHSVSEAVLTARMAREVFGTDWIKLEVIGHQDTLQPDVFGLVEGARILTGEGFQVFPYTTDDLVVAERLLEAGCQVLMPWCAPIGSAMGPQNVQGLRAMRAEFPDVPLIVDAASAARPTRRRSWNSATTRSCSTRPLPALPIPPPWPKPSPRRSMPATRLTAPACWSRATWPFHPPP